MKCWSIVYFHVCCGVLPSQHERERDPPDSSVLISYKFSQACAAFSVTRCYGYLQNGNRKRMSNL